MKFKFHHVKLRIKGSNEMNCHALDNHGDKVWFDMKSDKRDWSSGISCIIRENENTTYYVRPHRVGGPAIITETGREFYFLEGILHRIDGPAVIYKSEYVKWRLNGTCYSFEDWCNQLNKTEKEIIELKEKYINC